MKVKNLAMFVVFMIATSAVSLEGNSKVELFLKDNCINCHNEKKRKGKVRLDNLDYDISKHDSVYNWQDILDVLNSGEMPPEDEPKPKTEDLTFVIGKISENLNSAQKRLAATGGVIKMRHLNKREYFGSIKDLFGIELPSNSLPDDVAAHFDTDGTHQYFSSRNLQSFQSIAKKIITSRLNV